MWNELRFSRFSLRIITSLRHFRFLSPLMGNHGEKRNIKSWKKEKATRERKEAGKKKQQESLKQCASRRRMRSVGTSPWTLESPRVNRRLRHESRVQHKTHTHTHTRQLVASTAKVTKSMREAKRIRWKQSIRKKKDAIARNVGIMRVRECEANLRQIQGGLW